MILSNIGVAVLLGIYFIDKLVKEIFPAEEKIFAHDLQPVPILMVHEASVDIRIIIWSTNKADGSILAAETGGQEHVVSVERATTTQLVSETPVSFNTNKSKFIQSICIRRAENSILACRLAES